MPWSMRFRQRFPDYLFGQIDAVRRFTREQRYAEGQAILDRLINPQTLAFQRICRVCGRTD